MTTVSNEKTAGKSNSPRMRYGKGPANDRKVESCSTCSGNDKNFCRCLKLSIVDAVAGGYIDPNCKLPHYVDD